MADEPTDLTTRILRQVQETQAEHTLVLARQAQLLADTRGMVEQQGRVLADHTTRFDSFEKLMVMVAERVAEIQTGIVATIGYASGADARTKTLRDEVDDLKRRVNRIEEKV